MLNATKLVLSKLFPALVHISGRLPPPRQLDLLDCECVRVSLKERRDWPADVVSIDLLNLVGVDIEMFHNAGHRPCESVVR